jgi:hypothetical protein
VFSYREWLKKRCAEDPTYREKRLEAQRAYRRLYRIEIRERYQRRLQEDPTFRERRRAASKKHRRKQLFETVYGISLADYDLMLADQGGVCAICKKAPEKRLCVDHCHTTGKVRRLLCGKCNSMLGFSEDDPARLDAGAAYLRAYGVNSTD